MTRDYEEKYFQLLQSMFEQVQEDISLIRSEISSLREEQAGQKAKLGILGAGAGFIAGLLPRIIDQIKNG